MKTAEVLTALQARHQLPEWVFVEELRFGVGFQQRAHNERRIDAWAINCYPSRMVRIAYEVKVSRGDFLKELKQPRKRAAALRVSNEFYFAAPAGLIKPEEIPDPCGLIEVAGGSWENAVVKLRAPWRDVPPPTWAFMASTMRRCVTLRVDGYHCERIARLKRERNDARFVRDRQKGTINVLNERLTRGLT